MPCEVSTIIAAESRRGRHRAPPADDSKAIRSDFLTGYRELVGELGGDADALLNRAGIDRAALREPGANISLRATADLLEFSACSLSCFDFGLRLAARQNGPGIRKPMDSPIRDAATLGDIARCAACQMDMEPDSSGIRATLDRDVGRELECFGIDLLIGGLRNCPQIIEQIALLACGFAISLTGGAGPVRQIWFSHPRVSRLSVYKKMFGGTRVEFGQPLDGIFYTKADLACKIVERKPGVGDSESRLIAARYSAQVAGIGARTRQAIMQALAQERCTLEDVAASMGMHSRKLQRYLERSGMNFEGLRDDVRRSLAARYLARRDLRLTEIVGRLGYSEPAVFSRSCRRWFAATPSQVRRNLVQRQ